MATSRRAHTSSESAVRNRGLIDLAPAVLEIRQACKELGEEPHRSPFFFIVGAGISFPPVPLAATIIDHCQNVAKEYNRIGVPEGDETLDLYSHWFGRAYPGARQRQQYLRKLIERQPLSLSSLRLAHLLSARKLTNLVVTTNFDDFIARALRLFGEEPAVCDHPRTVGRIDRERPDVQIVHVHGNYLFYDLANLRGEVTGRARVDEETSFTMMGLLDSLLWSRSPLVIGYSGWEGDIIMSALRRRLRGGNPLAQSVYWFCYRRDELSRLPDWLRESADVRFVVPPEPPPEPAETARAAAGERATSNSADRVPEPTLPAYQVLDQLNRAFDIGPPALFENPIKYFADSLQASLLVGDGATADPYGFKPLVERLHRAAETFTRTQSPGGLERDLDRLRALMRESDYREAVKVLSGIIPARLRRLPAEARSEVIAAAALAGSAMFEKVEGSKPPEDLANVLVFDPKLDHMLGELARRTTWCVGSRSGQFGYEKKIAGKTHGAFTFQFTDALRDAAADRDRDGRISILEAAIEAGRRVLKDGSPQTPVVSGDATQIALFAAGPRVAGLRAEGTLHALLVGVGKHQQASFALEGVTNDIPRIAKLLATRERRLFARSAVTRLLNAEATRAAVEHAVRKLADAAKPQDLVMFYFSGHGARQVRTDKYKGAPGLPREEILLVFYDYDGKGGGQMTHRDLAALLDNTKAERKLVVLDF
jgi:hypothetical protein